MHVHVVFILWEESVTGGNVLVVDIVTFSLRFSKFNKETANHISNITKISLSRHMERQLTKYGFTEWVSIDLSKYIHVLSLG